MLFLTHNVNLETARSGNRLQNYTKIFNSRTSDCEIHMKCDGFVHYLAFGTRFRLRNLMHRAADREFRLRNPVLTEVDVPHIEGFASRNGGRYAPYRAIS